MVDVGETRKSFHWRHSLVFRVILLCGIQLLCLLGSVYVLTRHYVGGVVKEMEAQAQNIAKSIEIRLAENPAADLDKVRTDTLQHLGGIDDLALDFKTELTPTQVSFEMSPHGYLTKVARHSFMFRDRVVELTARVVLTPQTEIVRAFTNKYLAALTALFLLTLGFMVYSIGTTLRPLKDLSESCAHISRGTLRDVAVRRSAGEVLALEQTFNKMVASLREKDLVEANLRQAQRLSALGNLAAGVAHDVRNPLNAIKLLSSHALDVLKSKPDSGPVVKHVETIRREVDRLEDIVSGFLSLAKERELRPEPCRVDTLLGECVRLVKGDAEAREVRLITELRAGDAELMLDPKQITRAMLNVLINALEACPKGGRVRLFSRLTDTACEIEVRDDGPGMSKEVAERAFDPYFTTKPTGTGLGLSITRGIIEEHGGTIRLSAAEGKGCQVLITFSLRTNAT